MASNFLDNRTNNFMKGGHSREYTEQQLWCCAAPYIFVAHFKFRPYLTKHTFRWINHKFSPLPSNRFWRLSCLCTLRGSQSQNQTASSTGPTARCRLCTASPCLSSPASWPGCTLNSHFLYSQVCVTCVPRVCVWQPAGLSSSYGFPLNAG